MKNIYEDIKNQIEASIKVYGYHNFNSDVMLMKIAENIPEGEERLVSVSHKGKWNGAYNYKVSRNFISYEGHSWMTYGTLRDIYKELVINK